MTLCNDDGPSNGGAEALRVACRFWPEDVRRRVQLDAAIGSRPAAPRKPHLARERTWTCSECGRKNVDRGWCKDCCTMRP